MFRKILLFLLLFNIGFVYADSLVVSSESEFNNGSYENTYFGEELTFEETLEDSYTKLLMHFEDFTDEISHSPTINGDASIGTGKFNNGVKLDGNDDYISIPNSEDFNFGSGDFTIDGWINLNTISSGHNGIFSSGGITNELALDYSSQYGLRFFAYNGNWNLLINLNYNNISDWNDKQWYHIAIVRNGNNWYLFKDGRLVSQTTNSATMIDYSTHIIGALNYNGNTEYHFNGTIDELRISKGVARWTSNFQPPNEQYYASYEEIKTSVKIEETEDTNTKLLLYGEDFTDATREHQLTTYNQVSIKNGKFNNALTFDGDKDYITIPDSDDWSFRTGDFTIDFWVNLSSNQNPGALVKARNNMISQGDPNGNGWCLSYGDTGDKLLLYRNGVVASSATGLLETNKWYHIAMIRNSGILKLYIDGEQVASVANSYDFNPTGNIYLGVISINMASNRDLNGQLDELRISKGIARWTSNFQPPSREYKIDNTKLLLHFDGPNRSQTHFYDSSPSKHSMTINGDTKLDSSTKMFGESSVYFGGTTSDYIRIAPNSDWNFGTDDFTIETWIKTNETYRQHPITLFSSSTGNRLEFDINDGEYGLWAFWNSGGTPNVRTTKSISDNNWHHIVLSRENNQFRLFIDGILEDELTNSENLDFSTGNVELGGRAYVPDYPFKGYIDEFKITKGKALYTENFTPNNYQYYNNLNGLYQSQVFDMSSEVNWENIFLNTNISNDNFTKLLLHFNNGDESTNFIDYSNSNHTITAVGNAKQENTEKRFGESSAYFDGTGDYLTIPFTENFENENFTIDFWTRIEETPTLWDSIFSKVPTDKWNGPILTYHSDGWKFHQHYKNGIGISNSFNIPLNTWTHIGIIKLNYNIKIFINGELFHSYPTSDSPISNNNFVIGSSYRNYDYKGYLDEFRIVKGKAIWTEDFIPPNNQHYLELNKMTTEVRTCSTPNCSDGVWSTNTDLSSKNSQYIQFRTLFETQDISYNPELYNVTLNYLTQSEIIPTTPQYFIYPTPENKSNLMKNEIIINVTSSSTLTNCILHINNQNITMTNYGSYCQQNYSNFNAQIESYNYNVTFKENSENKFTENRFFTFYPDYSQEALPSQGIISGIITILIIIGGLFL